MASTVRWATIFGRAVERALAVPRQSCRDFALANDWRATADRFLAALPLRHGVIVPLGRAPRTGAPGVAARKLSRLRQPLLRQ